MDLIYRAALLIKRVPCKYSGRIINLKNHCFEQCAV